MTTFGVDQNEVVSDAVEGASAPTTSFTFDLVMTTDHELDEEVPEGFSRVIGDVNYFKVKCKNKPKQYFLKKIENGNLSTF